MCGIGDYLIREISIFLYGNYLNYVQLKQVIDWMSMVVLVRAVVSFVVRMVTNQQHVSVQLHFQALKIGGKKQEKSVILVLVLVRSGK